MNEISVKRTSDDVIVWRAFSEGAIKLPAQVEELVTAGTHYIVQRVDDWPMPKPPPYPADDEDDDEPEPGSFPPPEVWEFYREHGRWPTPSEA